MSGRVIVLALFGMCALLISCSGAQQTQGAFGEAPDWYLNAPEGCGVGSAKHRGNRDLTRKTAVSAARQDLAGQLETIVTGLIDSAAEQGETGGKDFSEELQSATRKQVVDQTLVGTRVSKATVIGEEFYALVCLDPEAFAGAFDRMDELSEKQREALRGRAAKKFKDLDAEIEKIRKGK